MEERADKSFRRAFQSGLDCGGDLARAARGRLHHRPAHRLDHGAGGVLSLSGADPRDQVLRRKVSRACSPPGTIPISEMGHDQIHSAYILYIGAGAVAAGGIISLFRSLPTIWHGLKGGLKDFSGGQAATGSRARAPTRTCR